MKTTRRVIGAIGVAVAAFGTLLLVSDVPWGDLVALALWLAAAVVVHDGIVVPAVAGLRSIARRRARTLPTAAVRCIEAGATVCGVLTLYVAAEIWAQHRGSANPTILTGAYGLRLAAVCLVIAATTAVVVMIMARRRGDSTSRRVGLDSDGQSSDA